MNRRLLTGFLFSVAFAGGILYAPAAFELCEGYVPQNNLAIPIGDKSGGGLTEAQFHKVLDRIESLYSDDIRSLGHEFIIERRWEDAKVNAAAYRSGNTWRIAMYGGLARLPAMTEYAFANVACHEVGHHLGGPPLKEVFGRRLPLTNEGGADYFSMLKCMRRYLEQDASDEASLADLEIDPLAKQKCEKVFAGELDQRICLLSSVATLETAQVLAVINQDKTVASLSTPDQTVVARTDHAHPKSQCRTDTNFQASLCAVSVSEPLSLTDFSTGSCVDSTVWSEGLRPRCWFAPSEQTLANVVGH